MKLTNWNKERIAGLQNSLGAVYRNCELATDDCEHLSTTTPLRLQQLVQVTVHISTALYDNRTNTPL